VQVRAVTQVLLTKTRAVVAAVQFCKPQFICQPQLMQLTLVQVVQRVQHQSRVKTDL
jgi:hypothetical protein